MAPTSQQARPALHNAMWPGLVGKGGPGAEPGIDLDTMLDLTAKAEDVYKEFASNLIGNAHLVAAGIIAVNRAQERGYTIAFAG